MEDKDQVDDKTMKLISVIKKSNPFTRKETCNLCDSVFKDPSGLKDHLVDHSQWVTFEFGGVLLPEAGK